jgi:hypothetical protein
MPLKGVQPIEPRNCRTSRAERSAPLFGMQESRRDARRPELPSERRIGVTCTKVHLAFWKGPLREKAVQHRLVGWLDFPSIRCVDNAEMACILVMRAKHLTFAATIRAQKVFAIWLCQSRRFALLRSRPWSCRHLRRSHSARREAGGGARSAGDKIRDGREPQDRHGARSCDTPVDSAARGRGDRVARGRRGLGAGRAFEDDKPSRARRTRHQKPNAIVIFSASSYVR